MVAIWVGDTQLRKRLYFQQFHRPGIAGRNLVVVPGQVEQAVDDQVRGVMFQRQALVRRGKALPRSN